MSGLKCSQTATYDPPSLHLLPVYPLPSPFLAFFLPLFFFPNNHSPLSSFLTPLTLAGNCLQKRIHNTGTFFIDEGGPSFPHRAPMNQVNYLTTHLLGGFREVRCPNLPPYPHPGGNPQANLNSISHRCHLREVAFEWELTKETINLPQGYL